MPTCIHPSLSCFPPFIPIIPLLIYFVSFFGGVCYIYPEKYVAVQHVYKTANIITCADISYILLPESIFFCLTCNVNVVLLVMLYRLFSLPIVLIKASCGYVYMLYSLG